MALRAIMAFYMQRRRWTDWRLALGLRFPASESKTCLSYGAPAGGLPRNIADVRRAIEKKMVVLRLASAWMALRAAGWNGAGEVAPAQIMAARDADEMTYAAHRHADQRASEEPHA